MPGRGSRQTLHDLLSRFSLYGGIAAFQPSGNISSLRIRFIPAVPVRILPNDGLLRSQSRRISVRFQICRQIVQQLQKTGRTFRNGSARVALPLQIQEPGKRYLGISGPVHSPASVFNSLHQCLISLAVLLPVGIVPSVPGGLYDCNIRILEPPVFSKVKANPYSGPMHKLPL